MNVADLLGFLCLVAFALRGFRRGAFREICGAVGVVAGLLVALGFTPLLGGAMEQRSTIPSPVASAAAFIVIYSVVNVAFGWVGLWFYPPGTRNTRLLLRSLGAVIGAGKAVVVAGILLLAAQVLRISPDLDSQLMSSMAIRPVLSATRAFFELESFPGLWGSQPVNP